MTELTEGAQGSLAGLPDAPSVGVPPFDFAHYAVDAIVLSAGTMAIDIVVPDATAFDICSKALVAAGIDPVGPNVRLILDKTQWRGE
jgi:hypothetical protein